MIDRENLWVLDSYSDGILKAGRIWNKIDYEILPRVRQHISLQLRYIITYGIVEVVLNRFINGNIHKYKLSKSQLYLL